MTREKGKVQFDSTDTHWAPTVSPLHQSFPWAQAKTSEELQVLGTAGMWVHVWPGKGQAAEEGRGQIWSRRPDEGISLHLVKYRQ